MLHPITCQVLNEAEKHDRAVQREAFQLRNKLGAAGSKYPSRFAQWASTLGTFLVVAGPVGKFFNEPCHLAHAPERKREFLP